MDGPPKNDYWATRFHCKATHLSDMEREFMGAAGYGVSPDQMIEGWNSVIEDVQQRGDKVPRYLIEVEVVQQQ